MCLEFEITEEFHFQSPFLAMTVLLNLSRTKIGRFHRPPSHFCTSYNEICLSLFQDRIKVNKEFRGGIMVSKICKMRPHKFKNHRSRKKAWNKSTWFYFLWHCKLLEGYRGPLVKNNCAIKLRVPNFHQYVIIQKFRLHQFEINDQIYGRSKNPFLPPLFLYWSKKAGTEDQIERLTTDFDIIVGLLFHKIGFSQEFWNWVNKLVRIRRLEYN